MSGQPHNRIGDLTFDSQVVWGLVQRYVSKTIQPEILSAYEIACRNGALSEWPVKREPGASYNPRPARLMYLLLHEAKERDGVVIAAAPLACADKLAEINVSHLSTYLHPSLKIAQEVRSDNFPISPQAVRVALSKLLDDIRHLHMTHFTPQERREVAIKLQDRFFTLSSDCSNEDRMALLAKAALARTLREER